MALVASDLAEKIRSDMGYPSPASGQLEGWADGVITEIKNAVVNHSLVTGTCPPTGGPLQSGTADNGVITGIDSTAMASNIKDAAGYPSISGKLQTFCDEIANHIMTGFVKFDSGGITGTCTNTISTPGALAGGAGNSGYIYGLSGSTLASNIHSASGYPGSVSDKLTQFCTAFTDYIMNNSDVQYSSGTVNGVCPSGGGPLSGGTALGGTIS